MAQSSPSSRRVWLLPSLVLVALASALLAQPGSPNVAVYRDTVLIPQGGTVAFGSTPLGVARSTIFTVTNTGSAPLLVSEAISVPIGFTLMASFPGVPDALLPTNVPAYTLAAGQSATFTVALNSPVAGLYRGGAVTLQTNVTSRPTVSFNVTGTSLPPPGVRYADDNDPTFTFTSGWTRNHAAIGTSGLRPFQQSLTRANAGTGTQTATWTFTGLQPGEYAVAATWVGYPSSATNAPYTISDDTTPLATVLVNQLNDSGGSTDGGSAWQDLGTFTITGSRLVVRLTDNANGAVSADGVRITRLGYPGGVVDDSQTGAGFQVVEGRWKAGHSEPNATAFQRASSITKPTSLATPTAKARWTFNVDAGEYRVLASFQGTANAASNSPYRVFDNTTLLGTKRVNQRVTPNAQSDGGVGWANLGFYRITSGSLVVELSNDATNGWVMADAVRVERINTPTVPSYPDTVRLLEQATWGPAPALVDAVRAMGFDAWLNAVFAAAESGYPTLPMYNFDSNVTNNNTTSCYGDPNVPGNPARNACFRDHYTMYPVQNRFFVNALYGPDQVRQRLAWALHKIWVVSGLDLDQSAWLNPYVQVLDNEALGNYRTLMYRVTLNPAMGIYLDMAGSRRTRPNENYPRELLQLFTIGLDELNPDGSRKLSNGLPIATYNQTLIDNVTKVFTGWNLPPAVAPNVPNFLDPMRLNGAATENPNNHDFTQKLLLRGFVQPARAQSVANAYLDLNEALDNIYNHPSLAPFVVKQLIQQLVTSNPSAGYVARVVDVFNRNRTNPNQLRDVARAILLDPEARGDRKNADNYGHLKEPVLLVNNLARMFDAKSADRTQDSDGYLSPDSTNISQDVWRPGSVFSYFSPFKVAVGGSPPVVGPEFGILTTTSVLRRANFVNQSVNPASGRLVDVIRGAGTQPSGIDPVTGLPLIPTGPNGTSIDLTPYHALSANPQALTEHFNKLMMHGTMSPEMKADLVTAISAVPATNPKKRVRTAVYLIASSSQYQVQK